MKCQRTFKDIWMEIQEQTLAKSHFFPGIRRQHSPSPRVGFFFSESPSAKEIPVPSVCVLVPTKCKHKTCACLCCYAIFPWITITMCLNILSLSLTLSQYVKLLFFFPFVSWFSHIKHWWKMRANESEIFRSIFRTMFLWKNSINGKNPVSVWVWTALSELCSIFEKKNKT